MQWNHSDIKPGPSNLFLIKALMSILIFLYHRLWLWWLNVLWWKLKVEKWILMHLKLKTKGNDYTVKIVDCSYTNFKSLPVYWTRVRADPLYCSFNKTWWILVFISDASANKLNKRKRFVQVKTSLSTSMKHKRSWLKPGRSVLPITQGTNWWSEVWELSNSSPLPYQLPDLWEIWKLCQITTLRQIAQNPPQTWSNNNLRMATCKQSWIPNISPPCPS